MVRAAVVLCMLAVYAPVLAGEIVASRTLRIGTILVADDLRTSGDASDVMETMIGLEVRRAIYAGREIAPRDLGPPTLIRRNDIVTMTYRAGNLGLRTQGRSLGAGGIGEMVEVINLDSRLKVRARVIGSLQVEVSR